MGGNFKGDRYLKRVLAPRWVCCWTTGSGTERTRPIYVHSIYKHIHSYIQVSVKYVFSYIVWYGTHLLIVPNVSNSRFSAYPSVDTSSSRPVT